MSPAGSAPGNPSTQGIPRVRHFCSISWQRTCQEQKLIVIGAVVALLVIVAAALGLFLVNKQRHAADDDAQESKAAAVLVPTFLPMDNMVVNLADTGGDRFAQMGITLELPTRRPLPPSSNTCPASATAF
jgi:hypothetical protein